MTLTSRLNLERSFAVPADRAAEFLSAPGAQVKPAEIADLHEPSGPQTKADTIRKRSDAHSPIAPLVGREDLTERFTHPYVLEAAQEAEKRREELQAETGPFEQAHKATKVKQAEQEVERRREEIEQIFDRVRDGQTLDAAQLSLLLDRDVAHDQEQITSRVTGKSYRADTPVLLGNLNNGIGSSALWAAKDARTLYEMLPIRVLRRTAEQMESRPREASAGEHVESVGVEAVIEADPHFRTEEAEDSGDGTEAGSPPTADPRREARPHFITT